MTLRREVQAFAELMEKKLRANDHKGGWRREKTSYLMRRLREEVTELATVLSNRAGGLEVTAIVGREAADVANFAMMIADVCGALPLPAVTPLDTPSQPDLVGRSGGLSSGTPAKEEP